MVATCKEAFLYHIPTKPNSFVVRESIYSFTSTMTSFVFDNVFLHVLTSTGVETFTSRHLYNALKDAEEFETFVNVGTRFVLTLLSIETKSLTDF